MNFASYNGRRTLLSDLSSFVNTFKVVGCRSALRVIGMARISARIDDNL